MRIIQEPNGAYYDTYFGLTESEAKVLLPYIRKAAKHADEMVEYYRDILDSGEATDRQTTALAQWEDKSETLNRILSCIDTKR